MQLRAQVSSHGNESMKDVVIANCPRRKTSKRHNASEQAAQKRRGNGRFRLEHAEEHPQTADGKKEQEGRIEERDCSREQAER